MRSEFSGGIHLWQVFEASKIVLFLVRHLRQNAAPDSLVKLGVARTPADRTKSSAVIFGIGYSYTYTSSRLVTDDGRCHSSSKASDTVRLAIKGILSSVIFWCING